MSSIKLFKSFIPWILYFLISGSQYFRNEAAAIVAIIAVLIFNFKEVQKKYLLESATLGYFIVIAVLYFFPIQGWLNHYTFLISNIVLAAIMWASIFVKKPFSMQHAKETVDEIYWETPTFKHINYAISIVWAVALTCMALDSFLQEFNIIKSQILYDLIIIALFAIAIWFTRWLPGWYKGFLFRKLSQHKEDLTKNPYLQGNYAPIKDEKHVTDLPIEGEIPKNLQGIYMRNGPNPEFDPISYTYPIDGDGMLHAIYIQNGQVSYRNRFVETKGLVAERKAGRALYGGIAKPIPTDPKLIGKNGDPGPVKDGAFIHIIRHAEQYLAMYESGPAYEVTAQLQTIGEWCPKGGAAPFNVNAHTRLDPKTGNLFAFTYAFQAPYLQYYEFNKEGELIQNVSIDKAYSSMMHDFVLTENHLVFFDCPAIFDFRAIVTGHNILQWRPELNTRIITVDRKTNQVSKIETEPFFVYHFANGFEQDGQLIVDYARHEKLFLGGVDATKKPPMLYRTTIDLKNLTAKHTQLDDHPVEFPRINDGVTSLQNKYIYLPTNTLNNRQGFNAIIKYDLESNKYSLHDFGKNKEIGEAVFIPSPSPGEEDDGYVSLFVFDKSANKSDFVMLDAKHISDDPVARVKLPRRVPHGLHGSWMAGEW